MEAAGIEPIVTLLQVSCLCKLLKNQQNHRGAISAESTINPREGTQAGTRIAARSGSYRPFHSKRLPPRNSFDTASPQRRLSGANTCGKSRSAGTPQETHSCAVESNRDRGLVRRSIRRIVSEHQEVFPGRLGSKIPFVLTARTSTSRN